MVYYGHTNNETLEDFLSDGNSSSNVSTNFLDTGRPVSQWVVCLYFVFICLGAVMNLVHFLVLIRCRKNGALAIIIQLCMVDFLSPYIAAVEIFTLNDENWIFHSDICPIFSGTEVLVNSLIVWLIISLNFHVISLWNLHRNQIDKKSSNPLTTCQDESNECLVTKKENANRTINIDYRKRKNDISVIIPIVLILFVCCSLSVPNFALSSIVKLNKNNTICGIMDSFYGHDLQKLLFIFRIAMPVILLLFTLIILIVKLVQTSPKDIDNILIKKLAEVRGLLLCSVALTMFYIATSFQRNLLHFLHVTSHNFNSNTIKIFKEPPLYIDYLNKPSSVYLSMLHYSGITCRALLYIFALPKFQDLVKNKIFVCCKRKE